MSSNVRRQSEVWEQNDTTQMILKNLKVAVYYLVYTFKQGKEKSRYVGCRV